MTAPRSPWTSDQPDVADVVPPPTPVVRPEPRRADGDVLIDTPELGPNAAVLITDGQRNTFQPGVVPAAQNTKHGRCQARDPASVSSPTLVALGGGHVIRASRLTGQARRTWHGNPDQLTVRPGAQQRTSVQRAPAATDATGPRLSRRLFRRLTYEGDRRPRVCRNYGITGWAL